MDLAALGMRGLEGGVGYWSRCFVLFGWWPCHGVQLTAGVVAAVGDPADTASFGSQPRRRGAALAIRGINLFFLEIKLDISCTDQ